MAAAHRQALAEDRLLGTDGSAALAVAGRFLGVGQHRSNLARGEHRRGPWPLQNGNAYHRRFKPWMDRFYGVATAYLPHHPGCFGTLN